MQLLKNKTSLPFLTESSLLSNFPNQDEITFDHHSENSAEENLYSNLISIKENISPGSSQNTIRVLSPIKQRA